MPVKNDVFAKKGTFWVNNERRRRSRKILISSAAAPAAGSQKIGVTHAPMAHPAPPTLYIERPKF